MPTTIHRPAPQARAAGRVFPSVVDPATAEPFTLEQELKPFGAWVGDPIWVPPKDASETLAETMLRETRPFTSKHKRWAVGREETSQRLHPGARVRPVSGFHSTPEGKVLCHGHRGRALRQDHRSDTRLRADPPGGILERTGQEAGSEGLLPQAAVRRNRRRADPHHARRPDRRDQQGPRGGLCEVSTTGALPPAAAGHGGCSQPWLWPLPARW